MALIFDASKSKKVCFNYLNNDVHRKYTSKKSINGNKKNAKTITKRTIVSFKSHDIIPTLK